jgi:thiamine-phosphate pyrophosphorylase
MHWRKKLLRSCYLYIIVKANVAKAKKIIASKGVDIIQLRDKTVCDKKLFSVAKKLAFLCKKKRILFILNDRVDIAMASGADGVHLGQEDLPVKEVRKIVPKTFLIGVSTHSYLQAKKAQKEGADYIGFGPAFTTKTKPQLKSIGTKEISLLNKYIRIPYFVIGNVNLKNLRLLRKKGTERIALHSAIYKLKNPNQKILSFRKQLLS